MELRALGAPGLLAQLRRPLSDPPAGPPGREGSGSRLGAACGRSDRLPLRTRASVATRGAPVATLEWRCQTPLDDLVGAAPARVRDEMERQARLVEGHGARALLVPPHVGTRVLLEARLEWGARTSRGAHGPQCDRWPAVTAGLLPHLAGRTRLHVAKLLSVGPTRAGLLLERHRGRMT